MENEIDKLKEVMNLVVIPVWILLNPKGNLEVAYC
jgi:hypothetical protein